MRIPKEIVYRNSTAKIAYIDHDLAKKRGILGEYDPNKTRIEIDKDLQHNKELLLEVVLHEIMHFVIDKSNQEIRSEEKTVDGLAKAMTKVFINNKSIVQFIKRCLDG